MTRAKPSVGEVLDQAETVLGGVIDEIETYAIDRGVSAEEALHELRVTLGLAHPRGLHHTPPGFASVVFPA